MALFHSRKEEMVSPERALAGRGTPMRVPERHYVLDAVLAPPFPDGLEAAAKAQGLTVVKVGPFSRSTQVPELGMLSEAVGAPFAASLPVGAVSAPIKTDAGVFVLRVEKRTSADSAKWMAQKPTQRDQLTKALREQRIRLFLESLKKSAKIDDRRKALQTAQRRATS